MKIAALLAVILAGGMLIYAGQDLPAFGDQKSPANQHPIVEYYINNSQSESGVGNIVTAVLANYRGYDTLGETAVIFTAGMAVLLLLRRREI